MKSQHQRLLEAYGTDPDGSLSLVLERDPEGVYLDIDEESDAIGGSQAVAEFLRALADVVAGLEK